MPPISFSSVSCRVELLPNTMDLDPPEHPPGFHKLFTKNVPHILEGIFFSLDYKSFNACREVSNAWNKLLGTDRFLKKFDDMLVEKEKNEEKLLHFLEEGNAEEVRSLLSAGVNPNHERAYQGYYDNTPLFHTDELGWTPLHYAAFRGHRDVVRLLLDAGANPSKADAVGWTPLRSAAFRGHKDVVQLFLERGADPNKADKYGHAPLHLAAGVGHKDMVQLLLEKGADPNKADSGGMTPLSIAWDRRNTGVANLLTERRETGAKLL